jgi:hypothetical protein
MIRIRFLFTLDYYRIYYRNFLQRYSTLSLFEEEVQIA